MAQLFYKSLEDRLKVHKEEQIQTMKNQEMQLEALQSTNQMNKLIAQQNNIFSKTLGTAITKAIETKVPSKTNKSRVPGYEYDEGNYDRKKLVAFYKWLQTQTSSVLPSIDELIYKTVTKKPISYKDLDIYNDRGLVSAPDFEKLMQERNIVQGDLNNLMYDVAVKKRGRPGISLKERVNRELMSQEDINIVEEKSKKNK